MPTLFIIHLFLPVFDGTLPTVALRRTLPGGGPRGDVLALPARVMPPWRWRACQTVLSIA